MAGHELRTGSLGPLLDQALTPLVAGLGSSWAVRGPWAVAVYQSVWQMSVLSDLL